MQKNLLGKTVFIIAVLIIFVVGIFGIPSQWNGQGFKQALQQRIHLGLDLRGGTHLILQVMVNDAINANTDVTIERLKEALAAQSIHYSDLVKPDANDPGYIEVRGVTPDQMSKLRNTLSDSPNYSEYELGSNAGAFTLQLKPESEKNIKDSALT